MSTFEDFMISEAVKRGQEDQRLRKVNAALLEALESCLSCLQTEVPECDGCTTDPCTQCRAKAAIKLAKGVSR